MKAINATFRHKEDGTRLVRATIYSDGLTLPTSPVDVGFEADDEFDVGAVVVDPVSGDMAMYGENGQFNAW